MFGQVYEKGVPDIIDHALVAESSVNAWGLQRGGDCPKLRG